MTWEKLLEGTLCFASILIKMFSNISFDYSLLHCNYYYVYIWNTSNFELDIHEILFYVFVGVYFFVGAFFTTLCLKF